MRLFRLLSTLLLALGLAACASSPPLTARTPTVVLISIDGLRADLIGSGRMPTLDALARDGVQAEWMNPSYPTLTFPNHYTLVTGLRPDHHGIVHNTMLDPVLGTFALRARGAVEDPRWWGGEPIWVTLQKRGGRAATMFWPGSEAPIAGQHPRDWHKFSYDVTAEQRVDQVLAWMERPAAERPGFITLYFNHVDSASHAHGTHSQEAAAAMREVDDALARLLAGFDSRGLRDRIDMVVVSDHGMVDTSGREYLDDYLQAAGLRIDGAEIVAIGEVVGVSPRPERSAALERALLGRHPHSTCWRKHELPVQWHYGSHPRVPPIVCQADPGWELVTRADEREREAPHGAHGYAPETPEMRAVFVADGPDFGDGVRIDAFDNVDVYPLLARLLRIEPLPNDGDITSLRPALRNAAR
ncbi:ectonucleotide pyrophosphatase/phosphodiesterase [Lysobacter sp. CFH 32150]|uniref:alkaline phosphatase family protein n=1 Tax=Lysobacter sp. CFH 32150 TaxID=2927128 RepID=UPI001FA71B32|nr:ectonucleotide pyrophosphatase/phosphodiesterase [Lysobacter sp. CFH 32150]MCI4569299.1 ectonucleotide pyrophosphatase/phosphodiesterase [Lysobacter sp. CFH 32150]